MPKNSWRCIWGVVALSACSQGPAAGPDARVDASVDQDTSPASDLGPQDVATMIADRQAPPSDAPFVSDVVFEDRSSHDAAMSDAPTRMDDTSPPTSDATARDVMLAEDLVEADRVEVDAMGAPDASGPHTLCRSDRECTSSASVCDRTRGYCVACRSALDCGGAQVCLGDRCAPSRACTAHRDCPGQLCDNARQVCVDCLSAVDCLSGGRCQNGGCVEAPRSCRSTRECTDRAQVCDDERGVCVECMLDGDCGGELVCGGDRLCAERACTPRSRACVSATRVRVCDDRGLAHTETDCASGEGCVEGACRARVCTPRAVTCEGATTRAVCSDDGFSRALQPCGAGERCEAGACVSQTCVPLSVTCASTSDRRVCDAMGAGSMVVPCPSASNASPRCDGGLCSFVCNTGRADCDRASSNGCEVDLRADVSNCGACGAVCPMRSGATPSCVNGGCAVSCQSGLGDCDGDTANGCETALGSSASHCGACGRACGAGTVCNSGACGGALWSSYFVARGGATTFTVARDPSGITVAGGHFYNTTRFIDPIASLGYGDAFLASYDPSGSYRWVKRFGSESSEITYAVAVDSSGNVYAAGHFGGATSFDGQTLRPVDNNGDLWVGSWTRDGNSRWLRHLPGQGEASISGLALDGSGNVWLSGYFSGDMTLGAITINAAGLRDAWVARLGASAGSVFNARAFGGSQNEYPSNVVVDPRGGAVLTVYSESVNFDLGSGPIFNPGTVMPILRLNDSLAVVARHTAQTVGQAFPRAAMTASGTYFLGLRTQPSTRYEETSLGGRSSDSAILAIDPSGALLWRSLIDVRDETSSTGSEIRRLAATPEGGVWALVYVRGSGWTSGTSGVGAGSAALMLNPDGSTQRIEVPLNGTQQSTTASFYDVSVGNGDLILTGSFTYRMRVFNTSFESMTNDPAGFIVRALR
jgi:hypothetical protein